MKRMILLDIDGTLLQPGEPLNAALLQPHIRKLIERGWIIGLNSGRMMESLAETYMTLDLNGPLSPNSAITFIGQNTAFCIKTWRKKQSCGKPSSPWPNNWQT